MLEVNGLEAGYGEVKILHGISLTVGNDEIVCVIGPNGAGKSTLMKTIFGLVTPQNGEIRLRGSDVTGLPPERLVHHGICYVPQNQNVFPSLTVEENLEMGAFIRKGELSARIQDIYDLFPPLYEKRRARARTLSGGQQQMVAMGRALMLDPVLLLLDEPTAGLSPLYARTILEKVVEINQTGVAILMIEQNARAALEMSHRGYILTMGRNRLDDTGPALLANREVGELFLGG